MEGGCHLCHIRRMSYTVQIMWALVVEDKDGESGSPWYALKERFATIPLAEEAGTAEIAGLRKQGGRALYKVLDEQGRPCGPMGPVE